MRNKTMNKAIAFAMAAAMTLGNGAVAFAADNSGEVIGAGDTTGHVEAKLMNVVLPVENTDYTSSTFNYTFDSERLIDATGVDKTGQTVTSNTDGVYFLSSTSESYAYDETKTPTYEVKASQDTSETLKDGTGTDAIDTGLAKYVELDQDAYDALGQDVTGVDYDSSAPCIKVYPNDAFKTVTTNNYTSSSKTVKVINQSSDSISLTVKAEAVSATTDIPLVAKDALTNATVASLYLGLKVGSETPVAIAKDTAATKTVTIAGKSDNFKQAAKTGGGYEYRVLTLDEYKALNASNASATELPWESAEIGLEGSTNNKDITGTTTAPGVKLTWSWTDPSATPPTPTASMTSYSRASTTNTITLANIGDLTINSIGVSVNGTDVVATMQSSVYTVNADKTAITIDGTTSPIGAAAVGSVRHLIITLSDNTTLKVSPTIEA